LVELTLGHVFLLLRDRPDIQDFFWCLYVNP
jgi:hypothetical protein